jgi:phosphoenolpyruvate---glycerone phosphotransferase subunit DhaM
MTAQPMSTGTVGIVLVSHSAGLAAGTAHLAAQVSGGTVTILAAGGTDDGDLGTSAAKVERALSHAQGGAGVQVAGQSDALLTACGHGVPPRPRRQPP